MRQLDLLRSKFLKQTLQIPALHSLFYNRAARIRILFLIALVFYFLASSFFPLWILLVGPIIWGVPHLISSLRYTSFSFRRTNRTLVIGFQALMWLLVFSYRIASDIFFIELPLTEHPLLFESLCLLFSFLFQFVIERRWSVNLLTSFLLMAGLTLSTYFYPIQTALVALIGHNYIPLFTWYKSCQTNSDLKIFWFCSSLFVLASFAIYGGWIDAVYAHIQASGSISFLNWDYSGVIRPFVSGQFDYQFWFHIVVLYAFSQSMHYFMWMKAIPENYQQQEYPPSFSWSLKLLAGDFGSVQLVFLMLLTVAGFLFWGFFEFQTARIIYFSVASYHGFMEISNIPFLKSNRK